MLRIFYLFISFSLVFGRNEDYKSYKVYKINFDKEFQQDSLHLLKANVIDFWKKPCYKYNITGLAMVPASHYDWFEGQLEEIGINKDIYITDVFEYLEDKESRLTNTWRVDNRQFDFNGYYRYDSILDYLIRIKEQYSDSSTINVDLIEYGMTEENRQLVYMKITSNPPVERPVIVLEAGINPREWITIPSALNVIDRLLEAGQDILRDQFEWIIIPVLNPDGYEYTHTNLRLWSKSRSMRSNLGFICPGVNLNRNFDFDWQVSDSSSSPCSHLYAGVEPFSEPETSLIESLIDQYGSRIRMYTSLQNNVGSITYPWNYERAASGMFRQHYLLGLEMVREIGDEYNLDMSSVALGDRMSGTSVDFARDNDILYTFTIDIADKGDGVLIPESEIATIVDGVWRAVSVAAYGVM